MDEQQPESLRDRAFVGRSLVGSRFTACDLSGVVVRGSDIAGMELDSPWLLEGGSQLFVNGVDVVPLVDAVLDERFPGRELRTAEDPDGLREAWAALERTWAATTERALAMPPGTIERSVDREWSFVQTLRHLILATDVWLGRAVLEQENLDPVGLPHDDGGEGSAALDRSVFATEEPALEDVLRVRGERQGMVRDLLASVTPEQLAETRRNPHALDFPETVLSCVRTILEEEWEHHRYAVRDLDALAREGEG